jgi:hypothetical protein
MDVILDDMNGLNGIRVSVICEDLMAARCGDYFVTSNRRGPTIIDIKMDIPQYLKRK